MKKRVLLLMTTHYTIYEMIIVNLEKMGFEVTHFEPLVKGFKYKSIIQKVYNFFRKTFLNDKNYKKNLQEKHLNNQLNEILNFPDNHFDISLAIRPDTYNKSVINKVKKTAKKTIAYQWDGMDRFKTDENIIDYFDVFGVFDPDDYSKYSINHQNVFLTNNFFFDYLTTPQKEFDILYIGAEQEGRKTIIDKVSCISNKSNLKNYLRIYTEKSRANKKTPYIINNEKLSYDDFLFLSSRSKCIIDIKLSTHKGLSFRFFEALYFQQKIITDNAYIKEFDFYNSNNILVVENWSEITSKHMIDFIEKPYQQIPSKTIDRYSFKNWFTEITQISKV